jgi:CRISPR-associated protein Cmr3
MNTILLQPSDVLFFRDGRPMEGSLAGHGAAWPLPSVINASFHAALHRAQLEGVHEHRRGFGGTYADSAKRDRKFGSLLTAGPFPVSQDGTWFFPRPADLQDDSLTPGAMPVFETIAQRSSLRAPARYSVGNFLPPKKDSGAKPWLSGAAYQRYLDGGERALKEGEAVGDAEFSDIEHSIGIAIDDETGTAGQGDAAGKLYSAHYLRLHETWRMGVLGSAWDKVNGAENQTRDLLDDLFASDKHIVVGGQQRTCSASLSPVKTPPLPLGTHSGFREREGKFLVKWVLLSPAVWPEIGARSKDGRSMMPHPGGWLPNWVHAQTGNILLRHRTGRVTRDYSGVKARRHAEKEEDIRARLVAALIPKPIVVTGWALPDSGAETDSERSGGACSTHLAVPAGAVYYFEADSADEATRLASALNWHGSDSNPTDIAKRRSTLMGEKGFGLGVCGAWDFHQNVPGRPLE